MINCQKKIQEKFERLKNNLRTLQKTVIAFSGGVDSTFLLKVAKDVLGTENVLAVTAVSETTPSHDITDAKNYAGTFGVHHIEIISQELTIPEFINNPPNKCYICKKSRFRKIWEIARKYGFSIVIDGQNADDCFDFRPGSAATRELGVQSPLEETGLTKKDIRRLSKRLDLPTWNKPSCACLASRIPYYHEITAKKLKQVDSAETFLRKTGLSPQLRVRHHGDIARLELNPDDISKMNAKDFRSNIVQYLKSIGFQFIALDLEGYSPGSLNRTIGKKRL